MVRLVGSNETPFNIVPSAYISSVRDRVNVRELTKEEIQEVMKTADVYKQQVILQDLLIAGIKMKTMEERNWTSLAAELYVRSSVHTQRDFLMHVLGVRAASKNFLDAMQANSIIHQTIESSEKGCSGLTDEQLMIEKKVAALRR